VESETRGQSSFSRGLDVLIAIARNGQASVAELAEELELPTSTAYRYVRSLREYGLIEETQGIYVPGWRLMEISGQHLTHTKLAELGVECLRTLTYQTSETSVLAVRAGSHAICLRQVVSPLPQRHAFRINELLPLYAGAGQRVLLAYAPRAVLDIVLAGIVPRASGAPAHEQLLASLAAVRRDGFALSRGEYQPGAVAVSVPVFASGEIACSLTLAGPAERCQPESWTRRSVRLLRAAADTLSRDLEDTTT
jgi:DNA-binding IclR family transcriptional regulator